MHVRIKRIDKSLPMPQYKTKGAAGMDLYARATVTIKPKEVAYIPPTVGLEIPAANSIGIGDADFCGDDDEYHFAAFNYTDKDVTIERGTRMAQMVLVNYSQVNLEEVDSFNRENRGGFGSTGMK